MLYRLLADVTLLFHFSFILFVVAGGFAVLRWGAAAWLHLPAAAWGVMIQFGGWTCPLTPLENHLRQLGGQAGYSGGFVEHYVFGIIYPAGLTRSMQVVLGAGVLVLTLCAYTAVLARRTRAAAGTG